MTDTVADARSQASPKRSRVAGYYDGGAAILAAAVLLIVGLIGLTSALR
jgi:hypothetical protein